MRYTKGSKTYGIEAGEYVRTPKGQQKRTSVPDFRRTNGSLQLGGVVDFTSALHS